MVEGAWVREIGLAVTVCDRQGVIVEMNERSCATFENDGGRELIGTNLLECHPEPSRSRVARMLETPQTNAYTIEKDGIRKLIYQAPWFVEGEFRGLVELSMVIPEELPHFVRG
jgi:hypothetical protein